MSSLFLKIVNMSIAASWLILAVILLRVVLKKAPKWINVLLWGIVAVRLICPFSFESSVSLIPDSIGNGELVSQWADDYIGEIDIYHPDSIYYDAAIGAGREPISDGEGGYYVVTKHDQLGEPDTIENTVVPVLAVVWVAGIGTMFFYAAISYIRLRNKVGASIHLRDNIWICDDIQTPFILGCFKPKIYIPSGTAEAQLFHIIAHENAHLKRRDHWWKPLGFIVLAVHWFNPLVWVAYILLCRDIELACDEKVIRELNQSESIAYSEALLSCSMDRRMVMVCPLAFGEVGVKERVKRVLNYKKPAFWIVVVAVLASIVVGVCFLTNPKVEREFPINGDNVSDLRTEEIVSKIAAAENLQDGSLLCVNADNFDLMFTPDFNWANDGAIRFFYIENNKTYSAQLRMFHNENKYFITDTREWIEQKQIFKLFHYLDALKYMPQEEIRKLSPDADGYSVIIRHDGTPNDYERSLKYSQNGVEDIDGWHIHLEVQPLHEVEGGAYNGAGDEVIHLFYNHQNSTTQENESMPDKVTFQAKILEIHDGYFLVEPVEGSLELNSADRIELTIRNAHPSPEPEVGDIIEIEYSGEILETYPARITDVYGIRVVEESEQWDLIPMVMVDGTLYLDTGHESTVEGRCGVMDGEITSQVDGSEKPSVNDQSNFGVGYGYQYGPTEGTIEIYMNEQWRVFATEEVQQEIQFPTEETDNGENTTNVWPINEWTEGIPESTNGNVTWAVQQGELYAITIENLTESEFIDWLTKLEETGFTKTVSATEPVNQEYTSYNYIYIGDEKGISVSYAKGTLVISISFQTN